ncbi:MAG TPA: YfiR family protein, partial [Telluria sp.]|nr:YfiR family protein [Telluria sp.]
MSLRFPFTAWRTLCAACAAVLLLGALAAGAPLQASVNPAVPGAALERSVKAAFLYKFLGYAEFPAGAFGDAAAPIVIGVLGADDMAADLARIVAGRTVNGRPVAVRSLKEGDAIAGVHLLFVAGNDVGRVGRILRTAGQQPLLLVTESEGGLQQGSVINFTIIDERVRFDVSLDAAEKNNVKLSSRLLTVAHQVHKGVN